MQSLRKYNENLDDIKYKTGWTKRLTQGATYDDTHVAQFQEEVDECTTNDLLAKTNCAAIDAIYNIYDRSNSVTKILKKMRTDNKNGGHPELN